MTGDDLITQYVRVYGSDWNNDNPYNQDGGIGVDAVFEVADSPAWRGVVRRKMTEMFRLYLERTNLAKLKDIAFRQDTEGEVAMDVRFRSIESDEELAVTVPLTER